MIHTNHRPARIHINTHLAFLPADRVGRPASRPRLSLSPSLPDRVSSSYRRARARSPPLRRTLGRATRRPRCIPRGTSARDRLYRASLRLSVCVTGSALLLSRCSPFHPRRLHAHTHTYTSLPLSLCLSSSSSNPRSFSSLPLPPPSPVVPSFFPLFLLLSGSDGEGNVSPAVSRLSPPRAPSAAFFRLFVLASSRAGNRRRLRRRLLASRLLSCLVKPRYSFERVAKSTKTPKALARVARVRACQC